VTKFPQEEISTSMNPETLIKRRRKRVIEGTEAKPYSQPWNGLVLRNSYAICGISLIQANVQDPFTFWAITANHCIDKS